MDRPDPKDEFDQVMRRLGEALRYSFPKATIVIDHGERDPKERPFERFEVFFMIPAGCGGLDGADIESTLVFETLVYQGVKAIEARYRQILQGLPAPVRGLGVHKETEWRFGDEVPEAEAMLGDQENEGDIPACWTFYVRFVQPIDQRITRCTTAPIHMPPEIPDKPGTRWVLTEEGLIREERVPEPPAEPDWKSIPKFEPKDYRPEEEPYAEEYEEEDWER